MTCNPDQRKGKIMDQARPQSASTSNAKWWQLAFGVIAMMAVSSPQYVWALFTNDLRTQLGASLPQVQVTFAILIVMQTFFSPFQGYLIDKFGPRLLLSLGALTTAVSWVLASTITTVWGLYLTYGLLGGLGTGIIYVGVVGLMVQWFPDRRGFAVGMVAAGYGMGAVITTFAISSSIKTSGVAHTLLVFGIAMGVVGMLVAQGLRRPRAGEVAAAARRPETVATGRDTPPGEMLKNPVFWLMFLMMTMMSTSGLMVTSQMGAFAKDFGVTGATVFGMAALPLALTIDRFANGFTRPFFGWVSDRLGRENTMLIAFGLEGIVMAIWLYTSGNPVLFVVLSGVVFFGWGEIFSLFPSTLTDTFGTRHATTNYGLLYMAQGIGSVLGGPMAAMLHEKTGSWTPVFMSAITMDIVTAALAILLLKPMRRRLLARTASTQPSASFDVRDAHA
jgi:oxalate/formate antiporter